MPRPFAGRVKEQKASSTRAKEILNVASDLSCNPTRRSTSQPIKVHGEAVHLLNPCRQHLSRCKPY